MEMIDFLFSIPHPSSQLIALHLQICLWKNLMRDSYLAMGNSE